MKVTILSHTPQPEKVVAAAARLCYSKISATRLMDNFTTEKAASFINKLTDMGHMSPTEHVSFTFAIDGVSRSLLAQITRHRIGSYSVQSLRYNNPFDKEEVSSGNDTDVLTFENMSYIRGLSLSGKLSGQINNKQQALIDKYHIRDQSPDNISKVHQPSYLRGIFDGVGKLSDNPEYAIAFPLDLEYIFKSTHFNITQNNNEILIKSKDALGFVQHIYENLDFASPFYDDDKLLALCNLSHEFNMHILPIIEEFINLNYYAIVPQSICRNLKALLTYIKGLDACKKCYIELVKLGIDQEDSRYILPSGTQTRLVMTMNVRSLYNFFNLRCCNRAQAEIRQLANSMLAEVKNIAPALFKNAGAPCEQLGYCPEGELGCGKYPPLK
ncbi:MAG: FAD-dependent thymidylate synthase [Tepidanaerobacteraceae bacterium]|jgi:thymidylate synthase (FAD)|nr:FAD-dependent thymidylate synthase [Thermoanaerobacterales bacterium]